MRICPACTHKFEAHNWHCPICGNEPPRIEGFPAFAPELSLEGSGFQPEYFRELAELEEGNFWFRARNKLIIWALKRFFPYQLSFLEIGCGTGFVLQAVSESYPEAKITGSEIFSAGIPFAFSRVPHADLIQLDARSIPYVDHFDVLGAFDVLEHIAEDTTVLKEMHKAIRPAGGLILTVPQHPWLWSHQDEYACHVRRYTSNELRHKVQAAGFELLYQTSFVSLLLPMMWMSRRFGTASKDPSKLSELRMSKLANSVLVLAMELELLSIRSGLRFPVGGSLLLVARKN